MKALRAICGILSLPTVALWMFLLYKILETINASELMWFLYWIYIPIGLVFQFAITATKDFE